MQSGCRPGTLIRLREWFLQQLAKQFRVYLVVGVSATVVHYALLTLLVESGALPSVPATLCGYLAGGIVSYRFNRSHAFVSTRPHKEAVWRFIAVASVGFVVTGLMMDLLHNRLGLHFLLAHVVATGTVMLWSFAANKLWTFKPVDAD